MLICRCTLDSVTTVPFSLTFPQLEHVAQRYKSAMRGHWEVKKILHASYRVYGITFDNNGNIYYTINHAQLFKFSKNNPTANRCVAVVPGGYLRGMAWDGRDSIFICDWNNNAVYKFSITTSKIEVLYSNGLLKPWGISLDRDGNLYVTDDYGIKQINGHSKIAKMLDPKIILSSPAGIAVSKDGAIYVCDWGNNCIRKIKKGVVFTIQTQLPENDTEMDEDTYQDSVKMKCPTGITFTPDGNLLAVDVNAVWRIDAMLDKATPVLQNPRGAVCIATDPKNKIYAGTSWILQLNNTWKRERLLWIGHLKEKATDCIFAGMPKDMIVEISRYLPHIE